MSKSRIAENDSHLKRGAKKKKRPTLKIILAVLLFLVLLIGAVGGKVCFDVKTAVTKAYVNPPTQMTSVSLKKKEAFTTAILGISKIDGKDVLVSADMAAMNPHLQQTTVINLSTSALLPDNQSLLTLYNSGGEAAVIKEMENLLQVKTNKFIRIDLDQMGELVQAIGGVSIQNANEFTAQGFKFPQGTVALNNTKEVAAYFTRLNTGDTKKAFARQQEVVMAVIGKLKSPLLLIRHYGQILTVFPKVFKTTFNFGNVKALALNYHGAISIKKINIHSSKVAGQSEVTAISQANLDLAKEQFQESLK
ncbi:LCP family protein [Lactococcus cremoris]|uniref:LCP family protein n=1 Tax=Lactococcus lactis subsp. cremoris TaxID=1359 RepID=UPI00061733EB|nr:LCP family protein [Lactococcus cremoris]MCT0454975.1 LytR family transcriptional regulator [Lactococcus cremoris]MCT0474397.1 LytR family transcriptional regulator [Lactococcus cremoris]MCT0476298.1 LytR family transcriptional regulator [Lactococcus cremoris]MCT0510692.1 LytR family transcriptional regulator [Lactococcus cremoris]TLQ10059.1 LytR family transcriptional regulator [Lactococcus cremoris]